MNNAEQYPEQDGNRTTDMEEKPSPGPVYGEPEPDEPIKAFDELNDQPLRRSAADVTGL